MSHNTMYFIGFLYDIPTESNEILGSGKKKKKYEACVMPV